MSEHPAVTPGPATPAHAPAAIGDTAPPDEAAPAVPEAGACPFLGSIDDDGALAPPRGAVDPANCCTARADAPYVGAWQQELVCRRPAHAGCPRCSARLREAGRGARAGRGAAFELTGPIALTGGAVVVAAAFVAAYAVANGGIWLTSPTPAPSPSPSLTPAPSPSPRLTPAPSPSPRLTPAPSPSPSLTPAPSPSPSLVSTPSPTPSPTPLASR